MKTVRISLGETEHQEQHYDPHGMDLKIGEQVVVETRWGQGLARVLASFPAFPDRGKKGSLKSVLRRATSADLANQEQIRLLEVEAKAFCSRKINERGMPMKLADVKPSFDRSKITFYFNSEERVDFRELVKELAQQFHTRIEMRQIGARDVASKLGNVGPCGRQLCCKTFLKEYEPIAVRMAKDQNLSLNPSKLAGMCGRLKCCLRYEHSMYEELKRGLPKVGSLVEAREGLGIVKARDVLDESVMVQLEDSRQIKVKAADLIHFGPPLDDESPRKGCGGGGGCSSGGCGTSGATSHDDS
ncbi:MAG: stage 0 sporulation protein [candidate division NC10 bacterium]|nr:stage 0 sporulation protein [candidate division NC10 bacterium]